jgi:hypothetical protein
MPGPPVVSFAGDAGSMRKRAEQGLRGRLDALRGDHA